MGEEGLLGRLTDEDRRKVLSSTRRRKYPRGEIVFHEGDLGDALHLIAKGHVAVRATTPLGDVSTFTVLGPGEVFGEGALLASDSRRTGTVVALEPVETQTLSGDQFGTLRREHPEIDRFLIEVLSAQVRRLSMRLQEALFISAETRVLRRLVELEASYRGGDGSVVIPLTQDDIASLAGTSRPTANRVLKAAEDDGVLSVRRSRIEVLDPEALERRAR
jgi:CRP/FNR family transcriptional regulator, cyclic AMP receptor protein